MRESDQLSYPVRQVASLDMVPERTPCPPADGKEKQVKKIPVTTRGTHTHTPPRGEAKIKARTNV